MGQSQEGWQSFPWRFECKSASEQCVLKPVTAASFSFLVWLQPETAHLQGFPMGLAVPPPVLYIINRNSTPHLTPSFLYVSMCLPFLHSFVTTSEGFSTQAMWARISPHPCDLVKLNLSLISNIFKMVDYRRQITPYSLSSKKNSLTSSPLVLQNQ